MQIALAQKRDSSQSDLARACGVKQPSVHAWLSGRTKTLKAATLLKAAKYLGVTPRWLAEGFGPMREGEPLSTVLLAKKPDASDLPAWPFRSISPVEWLALSPELRAMVEGYARGLMSSTPSLRAANH
jgi:transcriptional regulator with XRE-family HTH domain